MTDAPATELGSGVPDPAHYDPANRRFDSATTDEQVAAETPKPLPVFSLLPNFKVLLGGAMVLRLCLRCSSSLG